MRGRLRDGVLMRSKIRTTPAYAGKTARHAPCTPRGWDHPRVCGEDRSLSMPTRTSEGPPPRMRGRQSQWRKTPMRQGTTPAYAGKTLGCRGAPPARWDHPRVCGEDREQRNEFNLGEGPPPRMRGRRSTTSNDVKPLAILDTTASAATQDHKRA